MPPPFDPTRAAPQVSSPRHRRRIRHSIAQRNTQNKRVKVCIGILYFIFGVCLYYHNLKNSSTDGNISDIVSVDDKLQSLSPPFELFRPDTPNALPSPSNLKDCMIMQNQSLGIHQSARVLIMTCTIEYESGPVSKKFKVDGSAVSLTLPCEMEVIARKALYSPFLPSIDWSLSQLKTLGFKNDSSFKSFDPPLEIKDTLRAVLTKDIAPLLGILIKYHAFFLPNDETLDNINPERFKMEFRNVALIYYIIETYKSGRAYDGSDMYGWRYEKHDYNAYVMSVPDDYNKDLMDEIYKVVEKVYKRISDGVDFDELSPNKLMEWQNENGIAGMFLLQIHLLIEKDGWLLKSMPLTTTLTFVEAMTQVVFGDRSDLPYDKELVEAVGEENMIKIKSGMSLEQFHDELLQFLLSKDEVINKYGMNTFALMAHDLGAPLNHFHFLRLSSQRSWKPGNTFADGWDSSANDSGEVCLSTSEIVENAMKHSKDDELIPNLEELYDTEITPDEADKVRAVGTVDAYVELIESKLSTPPQQQKSISVTEIEMSILHGKWDNRVDNRDEAMANNGMDGVWYDPVPGQTSPGKNAYDPSQIGDDKLESCYESAEAFLEDTKVTRHVEDKNLMYVVPLRDFDAASICFKNKEEFNDKRKAMIQLAKKKGYVEIDNVLEVVTLRHM